MTEVVAPGARPTQSKSAPFPLASSARVGLDCDEWELADAIYDDIGDLTDMEHFRSGGGARVGLDEIDMAGRQPKPFFSAGRRARRDRSKMLVDTADGRRRAASLDGARVYSEPPISRQHLG